MSQVATYERPQRPRLMARSVGRGMSRAPVLPAMVVDQELDRANIEAIVVAGSRVSVGPPRPSHCQFSTFQPLSTWDLSFSRSNTFGRRYTPNQTGALSPTKTPLGDTIVVAVAPHPTRAKMRGVRTKAYPARVVPSYRTRPPTVK